MADFYEPEENFDPNYRDEVYYVYKGKRSTNGCICKSDWCCKCQVMILPVEGWDTK